MPGKLFIGYLSEGGMMMFTDLEQVPRHYRIVDPRNGEVVSSGELPTAKRAMLDVGDGPRVIICSVL